MKTKAPKVIDIQTEITKRNTIWAKSNKAQRAVLVAKDVILRLDAKTFKSKSGAWLEFNTRIENSESVQQKIIGGIKCMGCAMGGLMMSTIVYRNKVTGSDLGSGWDLGVHMQGFNLNEAFSENQQKRIERAFEGGRGYHNIPWKIDACRDYHNQALRYFTSFERLKGVAKSQRDQEYLKYVVFYRRYPNDDLRMRAIMNNIIRNKGTFVI